MKSRLSSSRFDRRFDQRRARRCGALPCRCRGRSAGTRTAVARCRRRIGPRSRAARRGCACRKDAERPRWADRESRALSAARGRGRRSSSSTRSAPPCRASPPLHCRGHSTTCTSLSRPSPVMTASHCSTSSFITASDAPCEALRLRCLMTCATPCLLDQELGEVVDQVVEIGLRVVDEADHFAGERSSERRDCCAR